MATTAIQSRTANIVVPSIHLGSFSPYPTVSSEMKHPLRFTEDSTVPVFKDDKLLSYPQDQPRPSQWRPNDSPSYQPQTSYAYNAYSPNRPSYAPVPTSPGTPPPNGALYPTAGIAGRSSALPIQPPNSPAQMPGPPREVCVECMMRDEDMADVDVTSPGVWDRESDVLYIELCRREEEEELERERDHGSHPTTSSTVSSSAGCSRPRARGTKLTEGNLRVWLTLNPREPTSKQQTLHAYLDSQNALLLADNKARLQAMNESRQLDNKMRDAYSELRRSAYDLGASASALDVGGVKIRSPSAGSFGEDSRYGQKRDTTLLENGMIVERVDMRKEDARIRKEERRTRKASRDSLNVLDNRDRERDATSFYSLQAAESATFLRAATQYDSFMSTGPPTTRSVRSMFTTPSASWQQPTPSRPMSMAPVLSSSAAFASQTSLDSTASPRRRFFGLRQWSDYFGSSTSLAQSGSMVDMHLGLDQEKHLPQTSHVDIGSNATSVREAWHPMDNSFTYSRPSLDRASLSTTDVKKKKRRGFGRLWKIITGTPNKIHEPTDEDHGPTQEEEDFPLAPPPPISYLVNRGSAQSERSMSLMGPVRQVSMPSLTWNGIHHPRSSSVPNGVGIGLSSPSDQSSMLPSPTDIRFPHRDSSGDEREDGIYEEETDPMIKKRSGPGISPPRPSFIINISEPDIRTGSPLPISVPSPPPMARTGPSSSSLATTVKAAPTRRLSVASLDKTLPPIPPGEHEPMHSSRSRNFAPAVPFPGNPYPHHTGNGHTGLTPGLKSEDVMRRQSFNGLASRSTLPRGAGPGSTPGLQYDDFGSTRHSLAVFQPAPNSISKRKHRFGLSALLGRRKDKVSMEYQQHTAMTMSSSPSLSYDLTPGHAGTASVSERSSYLGMNGSSRRTLDELVTRDPDFIAYRYPSKDERLDLSRS